ncbi:DNA polymerase III subunit gamma/tau [Candidatus Phytoplasma luffae]|uniref:DNA polymerase III subunit gamma/tau n=1 Tax=Loofah witches'-broom phytoplasma TaxID=35773 RepID=A0A975IM53_LOWBP|nr:DNA polymerase III subunit gamma/tau [Candidatus Phytoplasma luffae]QTX03095.1 DNA polymerase III subunit gamma/tau [Candidatus Phytoplasma luffae]
MTYITLYRKYRPKQFKDVVGQKVIIKTLINAIKYQKLHHCYLFSGDKGVGKTTLAQIFSKAINCSRFDENGDCCQRQESDCCSICYNIEQKKTLDIIEIDGASYSGVDEIRELKEKLVYKPNLLKYKIYIIDEIHVLSPNAFNSLLKVLEDPPSDVIFIFITSEFHKIPKNFFSRTQYFYLSNISEEDIRKKLKYISEEENIVISDKSLQKIAFYANGSLREPLNLLDQVNSYSNGQVNEEDINEILKIIPEDKIKELFKFLFQKDVSKFISFLEGILFFELNFTIFLNDVIYFLQKKMIKNSKKDIQCFDAWDKLNIPQKENVFEKLFELIEKVKFSKDKRKTLIIGFIFIYETLNKECSNIIINNDVFNKKNNKEFNENLKKDSFDIKHNDNTFNKKNNKEFDIKTNHLYNKTVENKKKLTFREDFLNNILNVLIFSNNSKKEFIQKGWPTLKKYRINELEKTARLLYNSKLLLVNDNKEVLFSCRDDIDYRRFLDDNVRKEIKQILNTKKKIINEYFVVLEDDWKEFIEPIFLKFLETKNEKDLDFSNFEIDFYETNSVLNIKRNKPYVVKLAIDLFGKKKVKVV